MGFVLSQWEGLVDKQRRYLVNDHLDTSFTPTVVSPSPRSLPWHTLCNGALGLDVSDAIWCLVGTFTFGIEGDTSEGSILILHW